MGDWPVVIAVALAAVVIGLGVIAMVQRAIRARAEPISLLIGDDTTKAYDATDHLIDEIWNMVAIVAGRGQPVAFGEEAQAEATQKDLTVVRLGRDRNVRADHWRFFVAWVLLRAIKQKPRRASGLNVSVRLNLTNEHSRAAFAEGVTPRSMAPFGTIQILE